MRLSVTAEALEGARVGTAPAEDDVPMARRPRQRARRNLKVGPLSLSAEEMTVVRQAAAREGMTPGAWAAQVVVTVARGERTAVPVDVRGALMTLVQARAQMAALCLALSRQGGIGRIPDLESRAGQVMRRLEDAADALDRRSRT